MPFIEKSQVYPKKKYNSVKRFETNRAPTSADYKSFVLGTEWLDTSSNDWYKLCYKDPTQGIWRKMAGTGTSVEGLLPDSGTSPVVPDASNQVTIDGANGITTVGGTNQLTVQLETSLNDGELLIGSTGVNPVGAALTAGTGIAITPGAGSITIASTGSGMAYIEATGLTQAMSPGTSYGANNAAGVVFTLPVTASAGTVLEIVGIQGLWSISQNALQQIHCGSSSTTIGIGGSLTATQPHDSIIFKCILDNTEWVTQNLVGNLVIV